MPGTVSGAEYHSGFPEIFIFSFLPEFNSPARITHPDPPPPPLPLESVCSLTYIGGSSLVEY